MANKEAKTNKKENNKNKKSFFKDFKAELKKVVWLTPKQLANNTVAVITIVLITGIIVFVLDFVFKEMNEQGLDRIKSSLQSSVQNNETSQNTTSEENSASTEETEGNDENQTEDGSEITVDGTENTETTENAEQNQETQNAENTESTENTDQTQESSTENTAE